MPAKGKSKSRVSMFGKKVAGKAKTAPSGWAFWIVLSFLTFFTIYAMIPTPPGISEIFAIAILVIGRLFFIKNPLKGRDIVVASFIILLMVGAYIIFSLKYFANVHFFRLVITGILIDVAVSIWYIFSNVNRLMFGVVALRSERLFLILQRVVAGIIAATILFWSFDKSAIFMLPVVMALTTVAKINHYPIVTIGLVIVKIISSAFL